MLRLDPFRLYEIAYLGVQRLTTASNGVTRGVQLVPPALSVGREPGGAPRLKQSSLFDLPGAGPRAAGAA